MKKNLFVLVVVFALMAGNVNAVAKKRTGFEEAHFMNPQEEEQEFSSEGELFQHEGYPRGSGPAVQPIQTKAIAEIKPIE